MQWVDILSGERGDEHEFPDGFTCQVTGQLLAAAEWARMAIFFTDTAVRQLTLELRFLPETMARIAAAGLWGLGSPDVAQLNPMVQVTVDLEARPELLARYQERLLRLEDKGECLAITEGAGHFPEFLKLGNYNLLQIAQ